MKNLLSNSEKSPQTDNIISRAEELRDKSLYPQSLRLFEQALRSHVKTRDFEGIYQCLLASGDLCRMIGNFDLAAENYTDAIEVALGLKSSVQVADAKVGLGLSFRAQGKWSEAIKLIRESKTIYKKKNDSHGIAFTLWAEAGALRIKGDIRGALKACRESFTIYKSMKDSQGIGYCLCGIGGASRMAGQFKNSLNYYTKANKLFTSEGDSFGKAYSYCGIGNAYRMLGDYKNAFTYFAKASTLYKKMGDKVSYAYTLWGIGTAFKMTGVYEKSREYFTEALGFFRKTKDPRGIIYCELGFSEIALIAGRKASARKYALSALLGSKKHGFALEKCHTETLISLLEGHSSSGNKSNGASSVNIKNTCYDRLGVNLRFKKLPLNIP
jgi:tetratricopeptide (TPR) repeat protein